MLTRRLARGVTNRGLLLAALMVPWCPAAAWASADGTFVVVGRTITQEKGDWLVDYRVRYKGAAGVVLASDQLTARVEGWVSNSRAPGHAVPRLSTLTISGPSGRQATAEVIEAAEEDRRCRERGVLRVWADDAGDPDDSQTLLSVAPGGTLRVQLRLEHRHVVYGEYDPLLGTRTLELWLGSDVLRDLIPLDREQFFVRPARVALEVPEDRKDTRYFTSAPDSLHLEAHVPGNQSIRFPEIPVRYDTRMRLRFSYLVAEGTEGSCRARINQYKDTPTAWKSLSGGSHEIPLTRVGCWTHVDRVIQTEPDATTLALDFRIGDSDAGEVWIDDVTLEPLDARNVGP